MSRGSVSSQNDRYKTAVEEGGVDVLIDNNRRKPNERDRVDELTEEIVVAYAVEQPAHSQVRASNELRNRGVFISLRKQGLIN